MPLKVLISGAGIAGPVLAFFLHRGTSASITVLERAPAPRTSGQNVDIRGVGLEVIQKMGLEARIRAAHTGEEGIRFVNSSGKTTATFPAPDDSSKQSFLTQEIEILRGDLSEILLDATKDDVEYVFDEYIVGLEDVEGAQVEVTFANRLPRARYDLVVAADGMVSKTRRLVFGRGPDDGDFLNYVGQYSAYFTIPKGPRDDMWCKGYLATKGRMVFTRPDPHGTTKGLFFVTKTDQKAFEPYYRAWKEGEGAQKELLRKEFEDAGWECGRILDGMMRSEDFYYQTVAQVKMDRFIKGRFACLGDSGYCPSPVTGMGTTLGLAGAYVLAGEISQTPDDIPGGLERYQTTIKPLVDSSQKIMPGQIRVFATQSSTGVCLLQWVLRLASSSLALKLFDMLGSSGSTKEKERWKPPVYPKIQ